MKREKIALITEEETGFGEICRAALEEKGFRGAAMDAVIAAVEKTKKLGK